MPVLFSRRTKQFKLKQKPKPTLQRVIFKELLLKFPPLSPRGHTFGDGNSKGEMCRVCQCGHLSELAVPQRGRAHCYALRGRLANTCWLTDQPRGENEVCLSRSRGKFVHLTTCCGWRRAVPRPLVPRLWKAAGLEERTLRARPEEPDAKQEAAESAECITVLVA